MIKKAASKNYCTIDIETFSKIDLPKRGTYNYASDPSTGILCLAYKINNRKTEVVTNFTRRSNAFALIGGDRVFTLPPELLHFKGCFIAHNFIFDYEILRNQFSYWKLNETNWIDTAAMAARCGLPRNLYGVSSIIDPEHKKLDVGQNLIKLYSIPDKEGKFRPVPTKDQKEWIKYVSQDIDATWTIFQKLKNYFTEKDFQDFQTHKKINRYGIPIDIKNLKKLRSGYNTFLEKEKVNAEKMLGKTEGGALVISSPLALKNYFTSKGLKVPDVKEATLNNVLINKNKIDKKLYKNIEKVIQIRKSLNAKAPKKFDKLIDYVNQNTSKCFFDQIFYVAHTGRAQCWNAQFYNFPRNCTDDFDRDIKNVVNFKTVLEFSQMLRGLVYAPRGNKILSSDFSGIENRLLLYVAGDLEQIARIEKGESPYIIFGEGLFNKKISKKDLIEYAISKISVLGLGYQTGPKKLYNVTNQTFIDMGIDKRISIEYAEKIVKMWRRVNIKVVNLWKAFENAFRSATLGRSIEIPQKFYFEKHKNFVVVTLPNGSKRWYFRPSISASGSLQFVKQGESLVKIYGGSLTENFIQSLSREILYEKMNVLVNEYDIKIFLHVYDEINALVKTKEAKKTLKIIENVMTAPVDWLPGLPLAVESEIINRWKK